MFQIIYLTKLFNQSIQAFFEIKNCKKILNICILHTLKSNCYFISDLKSNGIRIFK